MSKDNTQRVFICGVGMTKFQRPGADPTWDYPDMVKESVTNALDDAGLGYEHVEQAVVGYCYGESGCGQRALYQMGMTGIPMFNISNNCATGSSTLLLAKQLVQSGADCILAAAFEKVDKTSRDFKWKDRAYPIDTHLNVMDQMYGTGAAPLGPQMFARAAQEHMERYGTTTQHFAKIAEKNHRHSAHNELAQCRDIYTLEEIMNSPMIFDPLTKAQCCPTSDGGSAALVCSERFMNKHGLHRTAVEVLALQMSTDTEILTTEPSMIKVCGSEMIKSAAAKAFRSARMGPADVDVVELHDCFSSNELMIYEYLGLCGPGEGGTIVDAGDNTYGGKWVINPSGGLLSKGHALGATGLAQCYELCRQLRGVCGPRQVPGALVGLQQNLGLGGACVVGVYKKVNPFAMRANSKL